MRKKIFALLCLFVLFLTGCGSVSSFSVERSAPESLEAPAKPSNPSSQSSSSIPEPTLEDYDIFALLDMEPITYEEYFAKEQYIQYDNYFGTPNTEMNITDPTHRPKFDWWYRKFYLQTNRWDETEKVLYYEHDQDISAAFQFSKYLLYFHSGDTLYRIFVPDKTVEVLYEDTNEDYHFRPITNYITAIEYINPAFLEAFERYGEEVYSMPNRPAPYNIYLYDCRDKSMRLLTGYNPFTPFVSIPVEELYTIPEE